MAEGWDEWNPDSMIDPRLEIAAGMWRDARPIQADEVAAVVWGVTRDMAGQCIRPAADWPWPAVRMHWRLRTATGGAHPCVLIPLLGGTTREDMAAIMRLYRSADLRSPADEYCPAAPMGACPGGTYRRGNVEPGGTLLVTAGAESWMWWTMATRGPVWAAPYWSQVTTADFGGAGRVLLAPPTHVTPRTVERTVSDLKRRLAGRVQVEVVTVRGAAACGIFDPYPTALVGPPSGGRAY